MGTINDRQFLDSIYLDRGKVPSFKDFPFCLPAVSALDTLTFHPAVTFFVGENGSGKSTLLEAIAVGFGLNAEGGSKNFNFATRPSHSTLCDFIRLRKTMRKPRDSWFLRAESFFNVATEIENLGVASHYGQVPLHEQSHGESFFALFRNRFHGDGLYLLDEPEAALSPMRQLGFLSMINDLVREGSQFIIATHSPIIMAYPDSWIYTFGGGKIVKQPYEETEHFKITKNFLSNPSRMLSVLLDQRKDDSP
jgi:predicted ATPase